MFKTFGVLTRSAFDDDNNKEYEIEILTQQITRSFHKCQQVMNFRGSQFEVCKKEQIDFVFCCNCN